MAGHVGSVPGSMLLEDLRQGEAGRQSSLFGMVASLMRLDASKLSFN